MIELNRLGHEFDGRTVLEGITFRIEPGEKVVLLGVNGSGKSTLLKILNGLIFPTRGAWRYKGREITSREMKGKDFSRSFRREVVLLFQSPEAMIFNPTVFDEIAFGPRQLGLTDLDDRVRHWAGRVGVDQLLQRPPFELSGGEKQKVCLAALLVLEPELLLLDEPTANLDPRSTGWLVDFLQDLPVTTLVTTHNLSLGSELGDRTLVLSEEHRLIYDGGIDDLLGDQERLIEANLVHSHRHRHDGMEHRHYHVHRWK